VFANTILFDVSEGHHRHAVGCVAA
jgi:hypothetical protein